MKILHLFQMSVLITACMTIFADDRDNSTAAIRPDWEVWNEGVEYYRGGDVSNAFRVLRPLMLSRTHGARAAEIVSALAGAQARQPGQSAEVALTPQEEAADAAQIALRAHPDDARLRRNFIRAIDGMQERREAKRIEAALKGAEGQDFMAMLRSATYETRKLLKAVPQIATNRPERVIALADALSAATDKLADVWLPVREGIAQAVTNAEQMAGIAAQTDATRAKMRDAAKMIADLDAAAYSPLAESEQDFTRFFKLTALPPVAIEEGQIAQSNAWTDVEEINGRPWQGEALDFTRVFRAKFPEWARAYEQMAQADTNREPFTAEAQAKISALANELEKIQLECVEKLLPPKQEEALALIAEIRELLPKDKNGGQQNQQQNQQNQPNNQNQNQQQQPQQNQNQQNQQNQPQPQNQDEEKESEAQEAQAEENEQPSKEDREVESILRKAQERNDEHEADKKARMRRTPLPPNERDW